MAFVGLSAGGQSRGARSLSPCCSQSLLAAAVKCISLPRCPLSPASAELGLPVSGPGMWGFRVHDSPRDPLCHVWVTLASTHPMPGSSGDLLRHRSELRRARCLLTPSPPCLMLAGHAPQGMSLLRVLAALGTWLGQRSPLIAPHLPVNLCGLLSLPRTGCHRCLCTPRSPRSPRHKWPCVSCRGPKSCRVVTGSQHPAPICTLVGSALQQGTTPRSCGSSCQHCKNVFGIIF